MIIKNIFYKLEDTFKNVNLPISPITVIKLIFLRLGGWIEYLYLNLSGIALSHETNVDIH